MQNFKSIPLPSDLPPRTAFCEPPLRVDIPEGSLIDVPAHIRFNMYEDEEGETIQSAPELHKIMNLTRPSVPQLAHSNPDNAVSQQPPLKSTPPADPTLAFQVLAQSSTSSIIQAAPEMRNLTKEAARFVPRAVQRKPK